MEVSWMANFHDGLEILLCQIHSNVQDILALFLSFVLTALIIYFFIIIIFNYLHQLAIIHEMYQDMLQYFPQLTTSSPLNAEMVSENVKAYERCRSDYHKLHLPWKRSGECYRCDYSDNRWQQQQSLHLFNLNHHFPTWKLASFSFSNRDTQVHETKQHLRPLKECARTCKRGVGWSLPLPLPCPPPGERPAQEWEAPADYQITPSQDQLITDRSRQETHSYPAFSPSFFGYCEKNALTLTRPRPDPCIASVSIASCYSFKCYTWPGSCQATEIKMMNRQ